jgi:general secretion pathway protein L
MKLNEINELLLPRRAARTATVTEVSAGWAELFLPPRWPAQGGEIAWRLHGLGGIDRQGRLADLDVLPDTVRAARLQVWVPAAETVLLRANLPTRSRSRIRKALPFALEDQLLDPPESLNFSHVANADGSLAVAVTARARLKDWSAALESAGLRPESLAPAMLSVPYVQGAWTVGFTAAETILRTGEYAGQGGPLDLAVPPWLRVVLAGAQREGRAPERLIVQDPPPGLDLAAWGEALGIAVVEAAVERPSLAFPCSLDLLEGEFALGGRWRETARPFLPAIVMLGAWLFVAALASGAEWWTLSRTHAQQQEEMRALLLRSFPETQTVLDPARQMQRGVESLALRQGSAIARDDLLGLLGLVAPILQANARAKLKGIAYAERALTLTVALPDDAATSALVQGLRAAKLEAETGEVQKRPEGIEARLVVRAAAAEAVRRTP